MTKKESTTKAEEAAAIRAAPVLSFDLEAEVAALHEGEAWRASGHSASTLVKHDDMRVVLIVLKAGEGLHEHVTANRITVQTLSGRLRLSLQGQVVELRAGALLALDEGIPHDVTAVEDSAFLLTMAWSPTP